MDKYIWKNVLKQEDYDWNIQPWPLCPVGKGDIP